MAKKQKSPEERRKKKKKNLQQSQTQPAAGKNPKENEKHRFNFIVQVLENTEDSQETKQRE